MVWRKAERANPPQLLWTSVLDGIAVSMLDRALLRLKGAHLLRARYVRNEHENGKRSAQPIHEEMFHRLGSTCAPLSVHSGGKPIALSASENAWGPPFWLWRDDGTLSTPPRHAALDPPARGRCGPGFGACPPAPAGPIPGLHPRLHPRPHRAPP